MLDPCPVPSHPWWHLPVGLFIAMAGMIGISVPFISEDMGKREKWWWTFLVVLLTCSELRMIVISDRDNSAERGHAECVQLQSFKEIATTLGDSIKNNQDHFDKTIQKVDDAINTETGGTTFCYVDFDKPGPRVGTSSPDNISWVSIHRVGKYPLYSVSIWIIDNEKANYLLRQRTSPLPIEQQLRIGYTALSVGNVGTEYAGIGGYEVVPSDSHDFQVTISSFHSFPWTEWFSMRKIDGEWKRAMMIDVSGTRPESRGYYRMDEGFPHHKDGTPDIYWWPVQKGKRNWIAKLP
jgi:hypothetical protein